MLVPLNRDLSSAGESGDETAIETGSEGEVEEGVCGYQADATLRENAENYVETSYTRGKETLPHTLVFVAIAIVLEGLLFLVLWLTGYLPEVVDVLVKVGSIALMILILLIPVAAFVIRHQQSVLEGLVLAEVGAVVVELQAVMPRILKTFFDNEETIKDLRKSFEDKAIEMIKSGLQSAYDKAWEEITKAPHKAKETMKEAVNVAIQYNIEEGKYLATKMLEVEKKAQALLSHEVEKMTPIVMHVIEEGMNGELGKKVHALEKKAVAAIQDAMQGDLGQKLRVLEDKAIAAIHEAMKSEVGQKLLVLEAKVEEKTKMAVQETMRSEFGQKVYALEESARSAVAATVKNEMARLHELEDKARSAAFQVQQQFQNELAQVVRQMVEYGRRMQEMERIMLEIDRKLPKQLNG